MKYIQLQVDQSRVSAGTLNLHKCSAADKTSRPPDARFDSPVNGLESSALLLQFSTVCL